MVNVKNIYEYLSLFAPLEYKMDFDNVGLLVGRAKDEVSNILVSLDITSDVVTEALDTDVQLIVSHHPLFFSLKNVNDQDVIGQKIIRMLRGGISAICMHTNLDAARGGVNDALAAAAGISTVNTSDINPKYGREAALLNEDGFLPNGEAFSYGRFGCIKSPCSLPEYLQVLKKALGANGLRYHNAGREVCKVAIEGGAGGDALRHALDKSCDTFITADIKYDVFLEAKELGINLIDGGHYCTENLITNVLKEKLCDAFPSVRATISSIHKQTPQFFV